MGERKRNRAFFHVPVHSPNALVRSGLAAPRSQGSARQGDRDPRTWVISSLSQKYHQDAGSAGVARSDLTSPVTTLALRVLAFNIQIIEHFISSSIILMNDLDDHHCLLHTEREISTNKSGFLFKLENGSFPFHSY